MSQHKDAHDACIGRAFNRRKLALKEQATLREQAKKGYEALNASTRPLMDAANGVLSQEAAQTPLSYPSCDEMTSVLQRIDALKQEVAELNEILD